MNGGIAPQLSVQSKVAIHVLPLTSFARGRAVDLKLNLLQDFEPRLPRYNFDARATYRGRFNLEGYLLQTFESGGIDQRIRTAAFTQFFRSGAAEMVSDLINNNHYFPINFGKALIRWFLEHLQIMRALAVEGPMFVGLTLFYVNGWKLVPPATSGRTAVDGRPEPVDRSPLILPMHLIETLDDQPADLLRPSLDALWQACGMSHYFEEN